MRVYENIRNIPQERKERGLHRNFCQEKSLREITKTFVTYLKTCEKKVGQTSSIIA